MILEIISDHGIADLAVGIYTNAIGTLLTNTVTGVETLGGTQYVNTGWSMVGNDPALGTTNYMEMAHTNDAVLTWLWDTNYWLSLSATNGSITNATAGWKPAGDVYELHAVADVAVSVYDPALDAWEHVLAPSWEPKGVFVASGMTNRQWLAVLTYEAGEDIWDLEHGRWFGRLVLPASEDSGFLAAVPAVIGLPIEGLMLPKASGSLLLLVYDLAENAYIESIPGLRGGTLYEWTVPQWNRWYRVDTVREQDGKVIKSQWFGHMRTH